MAAAHSLGGPQVEDAVCAHRGSGAVVEIEEPYGAVDEGEAQGEKRVHRANRQAVERELHGLIGRLGYLPDHVGSGYCGQGRRKDPASAFTVCGIA